MTPEQAMSWLQQVGGELYQSRHADKGRTAWVAVVRTPQLAARRGKLIIALGSTMLEATAAAEDQWQKLWQDLGAAHQA
jgi:hypothetical protein